MKKHGIRTTVIISLILAFMLTAFGCTNSEAKSIEIMETAKRMHEALKNSIPEEMNWNKKNEISKEYGVIDEMLSHIPDKDIEEVSQFLGEFYYDAAMWKLVRCNNGEDALAYFRKCPEGSQGHRVSQIVDKILNEDRVEGVRVLVQEFPDDAELLEYIYLEFAKYSEEEKDLERSVEIALAGAVVETHLSGKKSRGILVVENSLHLIRTGIERGPTNYTLTETERASLEDICGTDPDGKVLALHLRNLYEGGTELDLHMHMMELINPEYLPRTLKEVEYIILFTGDYEERGKYDVGTIAIAENTVIRVYKVGEETPIFESDTLEQPESWFMQYFGEEPPVYYSGGYPEADAIIRMAIRTIQKDMK